MKCPKCNDAKALLLLNNIICTNNTCKNFNESWAKENLPEEILDEEDNEIWKGYRYLVTAEDATKAIYLDDDN